MTYTIASLKTFTGTEGMGGFNCNLLKNGKKIGSVINSDDGGAFNYYWIDKKEELLLFNYMKTLHASYITIDIFVATLADNFENDKKLKRLCKTNTLIMLNDDQIYKLPFKFTLETAKKVTDKYGEKLKKIINYNYM